MLSPSPTRRSPRKSLAEHLKRIRNDYCEGSLRDTLNRFVPQPAGPRRAIVRVPEPLGLHAFNGSEDEALDLLRGRMQAALDAINAGLAADGARRTTRTRSIGRNSRSCDGSRLRRVDAGAGGRERCRTHLNHPAQRSHVGGSPMLPLC